MTGRPLPDGLLDGLVDDARLPDAVADNEAVAVAVAVAGHLADHDDRVGSLLVPARLAEAVRDALADQRPARPVAVTLVAHPMDALVGLTRARNALLDQEHLLEVVRVQVALPADVPSGPAAEAVLGHLDLGVTAVVSPAARDDIEDALDVLAADGAELAGLPDPSLLPACHARRLGAVLTRPQPIAPAVAEALRLAGPTPALRQLLVAVAGLPGD